MTSWLTKTVRWSFVRASDGDGGGLGLRDRLSYRPRESGLRLADRLYDRLRLREE